MNGPWPQAGRRRPVTRAFTLTELMVVISIIALLIAILLPTIARVRDAARLTQCASNLYQINLMFVAYANASRGQYPVCGTVGVVSYCWTDPSSVGGLLIPRQLLTTAGTSVNGLPSLPKYCVCPNDAPDGVLLSYGMNAWASAKLGTALTSTALVPYLKEQQWSSNVKHASKMMLLAEVFSGTPGATVGALAGKYYPPAPFTLGSSYAASAPLYSPTLTTPAQRFGGGGGVNFSTIRFGKPITELPFYRHRLTGKPGNTTTPTGRVNIAYADGHVASKADSDLVSPSGRWTGDTCWSPMDLTAGY